MNGLEKFRYHANIARIVAYMGVIIFLLGAPTSNRPPNYIISGVGLLIVLLAFMLMKYWLREEKYTSNGHSEEYNG